MDVNKVKVNDGGYYTPKPPTTGTTEQDPVAPQNVKENKSATPTSEEIKAELAKPRDTKPSDKLRRAVDEINSTLAMHRRHLAIRHHQPTNRNIVTVYDSETNEKIREIPPESVLEAHAHMLEMVGLFMDKKG